MIEESELLNTEIYDEILRPRGLKVDRILRKTMIQLVKSGHATFLFLHDDESRIWWENLVKEAKKKLIKRKEEWRLYEIKQKAWERLSAEDRATLNITKPKIPIGDKPNV
jgi:hypothetical protein